MSTEIECLLTLITPVDVAEPVEDLLLARSDLVSGFTTLAADGHGTHLPLASLEDQVCGHVPRQCIQILGGRAALSQLLEVVRAELPQSNIVFWLTPVLERGHL